MKRTKKEIINQIDIILNPEWKFEMDDFYGDRGGIPYPSIESLDVLYWKLNYKLLKNSITSGETKNGLIQMIKDLPEINSVETLKIMGFGKYIKVELK